MYLSLSVVLPGTSLEFGIVGMMKTDLGTDVNNEVVSVVALVQMFVDVGPSGVGLGLTVAICRTPWEIIPNVYLLFPMKLKLVLNPAALGAPKEVAIAGGFQIGNNPSSQGYKLSPSLLFENDF